MDGFRGTTKSLEESEVIMILPYYSKVRSPPYCCSVLLDLRML